MAKKKLTKAQRKARAHARYVRAEYYKNFDALQYLKDFTKVPDVRIPNKITSKSLTKIRNIYNEAKRNIQQLSGGYLNLETGELLDSLPTKQQMVKEVRTEQPYRQYRAEPEEPPQDFDPDQQYIDELRAKIQALQATRDRVDNLIPLRDSNKTEHNYEKNVLPKFTQAQNRLLAKIDYAIQKLGLAEAAQALAGSAFIGKIDSIEEKYTHEIIESIDDDILPFIDASVEAALDNIE